MELFSAEAETIRKRVEEWLTHPDYELETTFGPRGEVDATTFLAVAQRLRAKGYASLPQEDRLAVITPEHVRFSLSSLGVIQAYCKDDTMAGKPYTVMIKDRATADSQIDLEDYDTRIKVRRETDMAYDDAAVKKILGAWPQQRKAFRMIRRWAFDADGMRIDMSIVRSTQKLRSGEYKWQRSFRDQEVMMSPPTYEIEVELLHKSDDTVEEAMKRLVRGMGEVLRGIQKNSILIRKTTKQKVLSAYKELAGTDLFRGPALRTMRKENFVSERVAKTPNIRDGYNVTDKADGLRCMGFVDSKGDLYLIDMGMNVYRTGLRRPELRLSLVDGEWVTKTKDAKPMQQFLVFDILYATDKREVSRFPFESGATAPAVEGAPPPPVPPPEDSRHFQLKAWVTTWNKDEGPKMMAGSMTSRLQVAAKEFFFGKAGNDSIFRAAARALAGVRPYYTDGLIFTPNAMPLPDKPASTFWEQLKWKPAADNTIDFLVVTEKQTGTKNHDKVVAGIKPGPSGQTVNYKTLRLYVGSNMENARDIILNKQELPRRDRTPYQKGKKDYKPVIFTPKEFPDPMAAVCRLEVQGDPDTGEEYIMTEHTDEPIQDKTIVEMAYDPAQPPGWRWRPLRVRMDKTERLQRGTLGRTLNSEGVAEDAWNSIHDPVTESMIKTGADTPTAEELVLIRGGAAAKETIARRYFDREEPVIDEALVDGMKKFHGRWIRGEILYRVGLSGEGKVLMDVACGVAGDLHNWLRADVRFVLGIDYAAKNIMDSKDSAYTRYMGIAVERGGLDNVPPMVFAIADSTKPLVDGTAGDNDQEKDILRSVFGKVKPVGSVPAFVEEVGASKLKMGADCISCMFAIHYFFETPAKMNGFLENLSQTLKVGGYFIGCCFDGEKVFDLLRDTAKGASRTGQEKTTTLWEITKQYEAEDIPEGDDGFGLGVDVKFISIGMPHREYLVPFRLLEDKMRLIGCELLKGDELKEVGMVNSSATFDASWEMARKKGTTFKMIDPVKQFSFMNRWFIFKRKRQETLAAAVVAEALGQANVKRSAGPVANANGANPNVGRNAAARLKANAVAEAATAIQNQGLAGVNAKGNKANAANAANAQAANANANAAQAEAAQANANVAQAANAKAKAANANPTRTVGVAPGPGAAPTKSYTLGEVFQFYADAAVKDQLGMKPPDKGSARWISPGAPFPIKDGEVEYPTMEHYVAGMRAKRATNKPELAETIFSREGTIHQRFLNDRLGMTNGGTKQLSEEEDHDLLKAELSAVKLASGGVALKKYKAVVDEAAWATEKDKVLEEALSQRWTKDARFRKVIETARNLGKYLLYYTPGATTNLGGKRDKDTGQIEGDNKVGKIMMRLAGYPE
jgi:predicted NAD-dependent protein-ADP-ribosyltransferase YbiA (DUF1768 family)